MFFVATTKKCLPRILVLPSVIPSFRHITDTKNPCVLVLTRCHVTDINHVLTPCHVTEINYELRWSWRGGAHAAAVLSGGSLEVIIIRGLAMCRCKAQWRPSIWITLRSSQEFWMGYSGIWGLGVEIFYFHDRHLPVVQHRHNISRIGFKYILRVVP